MTTATQPSAPLHTVFHVFRIDGLQDVATNCFSSDDLLILVFQSIVALFVVVAQSAMCQAAHLSANILTPMTKNLFAKQAPGFDQMSSSGSSKMKKPVALSCETHAMRGSLTSSTLTG